MIKKLNKTEYCPYCGSVQETGNKFCISCGANLNEEQVKTSEPSSGIRIVSERPLTSADKINLNMSTSTTSTTSQQAYGYGTATTHGYRTSTTYTPQPVQRKDNASIALIFAVLGFVIGCFLFPIFGFVYLRKAEANNEDPSTIKVAKVLLWIQVVFMIIGGLVLLFQFGMGFWYWY